MARLEGQPIAWVVTGSVSLTLQGVETSVRDLDLQTDAAGTYQIEKLLAEYRIKPVRVTAQKVGKSHRS